MRLQEWSRAKYRGCPWGGWALTSPSPYWLFLSGPNPFWLMTVQLRTCPTSLSVAGMKHPDKQQCKVERVHLSSQLQVVCPVLQGSHDRRSQRRQLVTADGNEAMHVHEMKPCMFTCLCSAPFLYSYVVQNPCLGNGTTHSGPGYPI